MSCDHDYKARRDKDSKAVLADDVVALVSELEGTDTGPYDRRPENG